MVSRHAVAHGGGAARAAAERLGTRRLPRAAERDAARRVRAHLQLSGTCQGEHLISSTARQKILLNLLEQRLKRKSATVTMRKVFSKNCVVFELPRNKTIGPLIAAFTNDDQQ